MKELASSTLGNDLKIRRTLAGLIWLMSLMCILVSAYLFYINHLHQPEIGFRDLFFGFSITLGYGLVGLLILIHKPRHAIGWLFVSLALLSAVNEFAKQYSVYGFRTVAPAILPGAQLMGWIQVWLFYLAFPAPLILLILLFPNGRMLSRRWQLLVWLAVLAGAMLIVGELLRPGPVWVYFTNYTAKLPMNNPTGVVSLSGLSDILNNGWFLSIILLPAALIATLLRYRRAGGIERQQLKWFVYFAILTLLLFPLAFLEGEIIGEFILLLALLIIPTATAIAILRHHLYDIDVIIKRTLVYGLLTLILAAVYFASVILFQTIFTTVSGQGSPIALVISTLIIATLFSPLRRRVQHHIDRRFYRQRYDAAQMLAAFATRARDEVDLDSLAAEILHVVQETMQPARSSLWLKTTTDGRQRTADGGQRSAVDSK